MSCAIIQLHEFKGNNITLFENGKIILATKIVNSASYEELYERINREIANYLQRDYKLSGFGSAFYTEDHVMVHTWTSTSKLPEKPN